MKIATCLLMFCLFAAACSSRFSRQTEEQLTEAQFDSLRTVYYQLNDTIQYTWSSMMDDDDDKLNDMQLLLNEIRKTDYYGRDTLDSLSMMLDVLRQLRYDSLSMGDARLIDQYDSLTQTVSEDLIIYADAMPDSAMNPVINVLTDQVISANNSVLLYRIRYDRFSEDFNRFLEEYKDVMSRIDSSGGPVYKRPMFRLINDNREEEN
jgi:hypothetical protein